MASSRRSSTRSLSKLLANEPQRFRFVQAVRLLHGLGMRGSRMRSSVGADALPGDECVRFRVPASRSFPAVEVLKLDGASDKHDVDESGGLESGAIAAADSGPPVMTVAFMGLFGPSGVLPQHDTQRLIDAGNKKNPERDFLDVFNHRLLSMYYRASIKYRLPFAFELQYHRHTGQVEATPTAIKGSDAELKDAFARTLFSIIGLGTAGQRGRLAVRDEIGIEYSGLLAMKPKNAVSLRAMLQSYLNLPLRIEQFVGQWLQLSDENASEMPTRQNPLGQNCALGETFILGERVWDVVGKYRIVIGPLDRSTFETFLPGEKRLLQVAQLAQLYCGEQFDFDIQLELLAADVPEIELGGETRLGLNTWLFFEQPKENKTDAIFQQSGKPQGKYQENAA